MPPPGFLPSRDGFAFTNAWPPAPAVEIPTPFGTIGVGNAALGLCGGMVFAALDYWHARIRPPADRPEPGSPLYRYVVRRLVESWRLPAGVAQYYRWMTLPDAGGPGWPGHRLAGRRGLAERTAADQWPRVKASLDRGIPVPLGLVTVAGPNPLQLGHNHQALAYGYTRSGDEITLRVYDPNAGPDDGVGIRFGPSAPGLEFAHNLDLARPVRGFFQVPYAPAAPPAP
jgi:hypothetical protein